MASQRQFVLLALALVVATAFVARPVRAVCEDPDGDGVVSDDGVLPMCNGGVDLDPSPADNTQCGSTSAFKTRFLGVAPYCVVAAAAKITLITY